MAGIAHHLHPPSQSPPSSAWSQLSPWRTSSGTPAPRPSSVAPRSIHMRCQPCQWAHSLVHWAQSGCSPSTEHTHLFHASFCKLLVQDACLQRSPFSTHGHPSTGVASPAPCLLATHHCFPAHSPGAWGWAVRPCVWGDIPWLFLPFSISTASAVCLLTGFHSVWTSTYSMLLYQKLFFKCSTSLHNILSNFFLTVEPNTSVQKKLIFLPPHNWWL